MTLITIVCVATVGTFAPIALVATMLGVFSDAVVMLVASPGGVILVILLWRWLGRLQITHAEKDRRESWRG